MMWWVVGIVIALSLLGLSMRFFFHPQQRRRAIKRHPLSGEMVKRGRTNGMSDGT